MAENNQKAQQLQGQYTQYQETLQLLQQQVGLLATKILEHVIVNRSLEQIEPAKRTGRKCYKMVGGVLVEKTVDEVLSILTLEIDQMQTQHTKAEEKLKATKKEFDEWITKNNVKVMRPDEME